MNSNGRAPTTVETWPGPMKPSRRRSGESSSARSGGTIVTWLQKHEKFVTPSARARLRVSAVDGAAGLGLLQRRVRARDAHHVAEAGEDHVWLLRHRDRIVDAAHRDHADRAA